MIVYGAILSPYVRKVLMIAGEKGIAVELKQGGFGGGGAEFAEASPFAKMPAIRDVGANADGSDYVLSDSSAIAAYLDAKYPDVPLIPADPALRGQVIWFDEFADTILGAAGGAMFFNRVVMPAFMKRDGDLAAADAAEKGVLPKILDWLDQQLAGRDYLVGESLTLADISVAMGFCNLEGAGHTLDSAKHPNIVRWLDAMNARASNARQVAKFRDVLAKAQSVSG